MKWKMYKSSTKKKKVLEPIKCVETRAHVRAYEVCRTQTQSHSHGASASSMRVMYKHSHWQIRSISWGDDRVMSAECIDNAHYPVWERDVLNRGEKKGVPPGDARKGKQKGKSMWTPRERRSGKKCVLFA